MDSSAAQDGGAAPGGEKRRRSHIVRQRYYREHQEWEKVNPCPVAVLGPVPSIADQTAELMRDPRWLVQQMRMEQEPESDEVFDWSDDEPEIFTGHEVIEMDPIVPPTYSPEDSEGRKPEPVHGSTGSEATQTELESNGDASTSPGSG